MPAAANYTSDRISQTAVGRIGKQTLKPLLIVVAALSLGALSLVVGYDSWAERVELLERGRQTRGTVVDIDVGVKGLKRVMARYTTADGRSPVGYDLHGTQWFAANDVGDEVRLYYDPFDERDKPDILIDRGPWIWFNPAFLVTCGILLLALGLFLARR